MVTVSSHMVGVAILDHNSESLRPPETDNENAESKPFDVIRMGSNIVYLVVSSAVVPGFQAENLNVEPPLELHETEAIKRYIGTK
ncbi:MAG TPA: hypothetical protein VLG27_03590 [Candidatus Saccharimonadia bacterium]|nr:hypothetical protein [Candidatus Saccharimonadia bacterium]